MLVPISSKKYPGLYTQIDDEDYHLTVGKRLGCRVHRNKYIYVYIYINAVVGFVALSHHVLGVDNSQFVDHTNHDTLDNRKSNLRVCSRSQNVVNSKKKSRRVGETPTSIYKGVRQHKGEKSWSTSICIGGKDFTIGTFRTQEEAAWVYDLKSLEVHGEFTYLNFPDRVKPHFEPTVRRVKSSIYRGVSKHQNGWQVIIGGHQFSTYLGYFSSEEEAALAYDREARVRFGDKAVLNFPDSEVSTNQVNLFSNE